MRDTLSLNRCLLLHPKIRDEVIELITKVETGFPANIKVRVVQGLRTIAEQTALYAKGRTAPGPKVTNAMGGSSYHNYGLAIDFALMYDKDGNGEFEELSWNTVKDGDLDGLVDWQEMVKAFEAAGYSWGGKFRTFKDYPHIEKTFGYKPSQLLARVNSGQVTNGYVNL
jgi:peptidoglycan LD-endopeptidase CwlK